jgi:hypothetical protein
MALAWLSAWQYQWRNINKRSRKSNNNNIRKKNGGNGSVASAENINGVMAAIKRGEDVKAGVMQPSARKLKMA